MPEGYIAVSHVVSNLVKKIPVRLSSCWTPVSGSFESIVEEDEELNDEEDLGTTEAAKITKSGNVFGVFVICIKQTQADLLELVVSAVNTKRFVFALDVPSAQTAQVHDKKVSKRATTEDPLCATQLSQQLVIYRTNGSNCYFEQPFFLFLCYTINRLRRDFFINKV